MIFGNPLLYKLIFLGIELRSTTLKGLVERRQKQRVNRVFVQLQIVLEVFRSVLNHLFMWMISGTRFLLPRAGAPKDLQKPIWVFPKIGVPQNGW